MVPQSRFLPVALIAAALLGACGGDGDSNACGDLGGALGSAAAGDEVRLGACRVNGGFEVPEGVRLVGTGPEASIVEGSLVVRSGASVTGLAVEAAVGTAVTLAGTSSLSNVRVSGPVTAANATSIPAAPDPAATATHGVLIENATATLDEVTVVGFASFGVLAIESDVTISDSSASENLGVGIAARGGTITLDGVEVCRTMSGLRPLPAYGVLLVGGVDATTVGLDACENEGLGVLSDGSRAVHSDLVATSNAESAVWAQRGGELEISGTGTLLADNGVAAIVGVMTEDLTVMDASIERTRLTTRLVEGLGNIDTGDGIQLVVDSTAQIRLDAVTATGNERAGVVLDLPDGGTVTDTAIGAVTVAGSGGALGVVAQTPSGPIPSGTWDTSVVRDGATSANDASFAGGLDVVGIIGPMYLPPVP